MTVWYNAKKDQICLANQTKTHFDSTQIPPGRPGMKAGLINKNVRSYRDLIHSGWVYIGRLNPFNET